jgi:hypothetical protein
MTTVTRQVHFATKSRRKRAVPGPPPAPKPPKPEGRTPRVAKLMALAIRFDQLLRDGKVADQSELARLAHVTQPRMTQIMNLLHLAPDIQEDILHLPPVVEGSDSITERHLRPIARLADWQAQRRSWIGLKSILGYLGRRSDTLYTIPILEDRCILPDGTEITPGAEVAA